MHYKIECRFMKQNLLKAKPALYFQFYEEIEMKITEDTAHPIPPTISFNTHIVQLTDGIGDEPSTFTEQNQYGMHL